MATLEEFKALRAGVAPEVQKELGNLVFSDLDVGFSRIVEIAVEKGMTLTIDELRSFLRAMQEEEDFDDLELDPIALTAIAGGQLGAAGGC